jgi:6-pyruvoyl-tetrahydropterin synthase
MFEVSVSTSFPAVHAVTISGVEETPHSHDWKVLAVVSCDALDSDNLLIDFLQLESDLENVVARLRDTDLNANPVLQGNNPSTEFVAMYIATELAKKVNSPACLDSIALTEAPNCIATYRL